MRFLLTVSSFSFAGLSWPLFSIYREAHPRHLGPPWLGPIYRCRARESVVLHWRGRPRYQGLGFGFGRAQALPHGSHLHGSRSRCLAETPVPVLGGRGQGAAAAAAASASFFDLPLSFSFRRWSNAGILRPTRLFDNTTVISLASTRLSESLPSPTDGPQSSR